ncbi:hypothetical protein PG997_014848 [Apiospora hydei]|uniref:Uncharacterized protein n=1 Tax=Apiospora hydei TaxID=1337664 RepID=A0ABR1UXI0_9PEZI
MQFVTISAIAFLAAGAVAMPNAAADEHTLQARCAAIFPLATAATSSGRPTAAAKARRRSAMSGPAPERERTLS